MLANMRMKKLAEIGKRQSSIVANVKLDRRLTSGHKTQLNLPTETEKRKTTIVNVCAVELMILFRFQI